MERVWVLGNWGGGSYGDVKPSYGGAGGWNRRGCATGAPRSAKRQGNTDTQNAGATPGGTRASTADKEEGHSKAGEATRTAGTGNQNGADGRACAWEAATIKGMAWPASPVATGCQGNPCSTGIRWGVSPAAQMGCLRNRSGSPSAHHATLSTATTGLRERRNDTSKSTGHSGRQKAATRRNMRREERVTVQGPVKEQQPDGMSHRGAIGDHSPRGCGGGASRSGGGGGGCTKGGLGEGAWPSGPQATCGG